MKLFPGIINNWFKTVCGCEQRLFSTGCFSSFSKTSWVLNFKQDSDKRITGGNSTKVISLLFCLFQFSN